MNQQKIGNLILVIACTQPLFLLSIKGWANGILILCTLFSMVYAFSYRTNLKIYEIKLNSNEKWFAIAFLMPLIATTVSTIFRNDFNIEQFDSPSRFIFALILYISLRKIDIKIDQHLIRSISAGLLIAFIYQIFINGFTIDPSARARTYFMDPIMFGYITLSFCLITLYFALALQTSNEWMRYLFIASGLVALYLNILSRTRTGWLSVFFVIIVYLIQSKNSTKIKGKPYMIISIVLFSLLLLPLFKNIENRFGQISNDISSYKFNGIAPDSSIGQRITYIRIAIDLISKKPLQGYGDTAKNAPELSENAKSFSSDYIQETVFKVGFHNELIASTIRSGILGGISVIFAFLIPLIISLKQIRSDVATKKNSATMASILILVVSASSITIETFGLKFAASFYACMIGILMINILKTNENPRPTTS